MSKSTITPQRKHYKLLKSSHSGAPTGEVWPEDVERVFVDGLRAYWQSPWASYSTGRSRWRNQFLVDYLHNHGITRTKKQVASHLQVLRNMWKGQPQSNLLIGLEDPKAEDVSQLALFDDLDTQSPMSSPNFSVSDITSSPDSSPAYSDSARLPEERSHHLTQHPNINSVTTFFLCAGGMEPLTVNIDALPLPPLHNLPVVLKIRLQIPSGMNSPITHGFDASLRFAHMWAGHARCTTKVYLQGVPSSTESGSLNVNSIDLGCPIATLPNSNLNNCRWLEPTVHTTITQEITVDERTVLIVFYELDRHHNFPAAHVLRYQRYRPGAILPSSPQFMPDFLPMPTTSDLSPEVKVELIDSSLPFQYYTSPFNSAAATLSTDTSLSNALG
ncbi:hypothetical protein VKT23_004172 [Stygiomarasmius scandens]|uniref:TEA domain-containing protein n=1 Tax=Marasmiellus scandens TaxID=2682957 RepID=A0ABR1JUV7_9AGAR